MIRKTGHNATYSTAKFLKNLLSDDEHYTVLEMGRSWKQRQYRNNFTDNEFYGEPKRMALPTVPYSFETKDGIKWDISYTFNGIRNNTVNGRKYGSIIEMDRLYYILVNTFNNGEDFVQKYLLDIAPTLLGDDIKKVIEPTVSKIADSLCFKSQAEADKALEKAVKAEEKLKKMNYDFKTPIKKGRKGYSAQKTFNAFTSALDSNKIKIDENLWEEESEKVSELLRTGFELAMYSGASVVNKFPSNSTQIKRLYAGLEDFPMFFATGQFAKSIDFNVRIYND